MISIDPTLVPARDVYRLIAGLVIPRPIAWISTINADGSANLAPFSFYNAVSGNPPVVMISIGSRGGTPKDTLRNIQETGEFVVHLADEALARAMNLTSSDLPYGVDEFNLAGLAKVASDTVRPPRIASAPAAMEAKATQFVPIEGSTYTLVLGRVTRFHLREGLLRPDGTPDSRGLAPVARLTGDEYSALGEIFSLSRPSVVERPLTAGRPSN